MVPILVSLVCLVILFLTGAILDFKEPKMRDDQTIRVLGRTGARELTQKEISYIGGAVCSFVGDVPNCTFIVTNHLGVHDLKAD